SARLSWTTMRAGCLPRARILVRAAAMEGEASSVPRRLTRKTSGPLFSRGVDSGFLPNTHARIPPATMLATTTREEIPTTQPRRDGTVGGSPPTRWVEDAG